MADPSKIPTVEVVGVAGLLFGSTGLWAYLTARFRSKRSPPAAMTSAEAGLVDSAGRFAKDFGAAAGALIENYRAELQQQVARIDGLESKINACEERHEDCEARVGDVTRRLDQSEHDRAKEREDFRAEVARLMREPIALPFENPPKD